MLTAPYMPACLPACQNAFARLLPCLLLYPPLLPPCLPFPPVQLYKAFAGTYQNEISFEPGTGTRPPPNWQKRLFGDAYNRLVKVQKKYDPQGRMATPQYSVGWVPPK